MIKKIIQLGDVHIRNLRRQDEYQEQLQKTIDACKNIVSKYSNDEVRIVVCGDLFHNKTEISPEGYALAAWFLRQLDSICKTIVFSGNHDKTENLARLDPLSVLFSMCKFEQTYFLDKEMDYQSNCVEDDNVVWCLYSAFDGFARPQLLESLKVMNPEKKFIGLFHGELKSAKTDTGFISESGLPANYFDGVDFGLLGHIHKRQCISNDGVPLVYCGSLIQQDHGENLSGHGFIIWNVDDISYDVYNIENNNYGFYTFSINSIDEIDNDLEEIINL